MSFSVDTIQLVIDVKPDKAREALLDLGKQGRSAARDLKNIEKQFGKNSKEYKAQEELVKQLNNEYRAQRQQLDLNAMSLRELGNLQKTLTLEMKKVPGNSQVYKELSTQLKQVNTRMRALRAEANDTRTTMRKLGDATQKYAAMATAAITAVIALYNKLRKATDTYAQMEEAMTAPRKYAAMTKEEVEDLNETFKKMDTRTAREELNRLAGEAGKLGIRGKQNILDFVDAADQLTMALGEGLGEDAVKNIGKLAMMFGESDRLGLRGAMLATGSAINEVAQNSSASYGYLADFTARVSGAANQAKIAQADIMGFASVLDQNMQAVEMSGSAFQKLMLKMYQAPEEFARAAGMEVKSFAKLIRTDANEAILTLLSTLNKKGGLERLAPMFQQLGLDGVRASAVMSVLAGKVEDIRKQQQLANEAYEKAVSVTNEAAVKNNTVLAEQEKRANAMKNQWEKIGKALEPIVTLMENVATEVLKGLSLLVTAITYPLRLAIEKGGVLLEVLKRSLPLIGTIIGAVDNLKSNLKKLISLFPSLTDLLSKIPLIGDKIAAMAGDVDGTREAQQKFNDELERTTRLMANIDAAVKKGSNLAGMSDEQQTTLKASAEANIAILDNEIEQLQQRANKLKALGADASTQRKEPGTFGGAYNFADDELRALEDEIERYAQAKGKLQAVANKIDKAEEEKRKKEEEERKKRAAEEQKVKDEIAYKQQEAAIIAGTLKARNLRKQQYIDEKGDAEQYQKDLEKIETDGLLARIALQDKYHKDKEELQGQLYDRMIAQADKEAARRRAAEKKQQDADKAEEKKRQAEEEAARRKAEKEAADRKRDDRRGGERQMDKLAERYDFKAMEQLNQAMYDADLISYEEYEDMKTQIAREQSEARQQAASSSFQVMAEAASAAGQVISALQDAEVSKVTRDYDKKIKAAKKAGKDTSKLEEQKEEAINGVKKKYADKTFAASVMQVTASTAVSAMEAYKAMAGIPFVGPALGAAAAAAAVAAGAAQIAVAKKQRDEAKGLYEGGYSDDYVEGYTRAGNPRESAGVIPVHRNEFVANHEAVGNPHVRRFLDIFNTAQKNGTIRLINTTQILEQAGMRTGKYAGGYATDGAAGKTATPATSTPEQGVTSAERTQVVKLLQRNNELLELIEKKRLIVDPREVRDGIRNVEALERRVSR
jgi:TP901 family phage tail tape measure protein